MSSSSQAESGGNASLSPTRRKPPSIPSTAPQISDALRQRLANITKLRPGGNSATTGDPEVGGKFPAITRNMSGHDRADMQPPPVPRTHPFEARMMMPPPVRRPDLPPMPATVSRPNTPPASGITIRTARRPSAAVPNGDAPVNTPPRKLSATVMPPIVARKIAATNFARPTPPASSSNNSNSNMRNNIYGSNSNGSLQPQQATPSSQNNSNGSSANSTMKLYRAAVGGDTTATNATPKSVTSHMTPASATKAMPGTSVGNQFQKPRPNFSRPTTPPTNVSTTGPSAVTRDAHSEATATNNNAQLSEQADRIKLLESARNKLRLAQAEQERGHTETENSSGKVNDNAGIDKALTADDKKLGLVDGTTSPSARSDEVPRLMMRMFSNGSRSPSQPASPAPGAANSNNSSKPPSKPGSAPRSASHSPRRKLSIDVGRTVVQAAKPAAAATSVDHHQTTTAATATEREDKQEQQLRRYSTEVERLNATVEKLTRELFEQRTRADAAHSSLTDKCSAVDSLERRMSHRERAIGAQLAEAAEREADLTATVKKLRYELLQSQTEMEAERAALMQDHVHMDRVEEMREEHARALQAVGEEAEQLRVRNEESEHRCQELSAELASVKEQWAEAQAIHAEDIRRAEQRADELATSVEEAEASAADTEAALADSRAANAELARTLEAAQQAKAKTEQRADELKVALEIAEMNVAAVRAKLDTATAECEALTSQLSAQSSNSQKSPLQQHLSEKEATELFDVLEQLQQENQLLRTSMEQRQSKRMSMMPPGEQQQQQQHNMVKYLEDYVSDLTAAFTDLETERNQIAARLQELEQAAPSSNNNTTAEPIYISNDTELLAFIELMSTKVKSYSDQVDTLLQENKELRDGQPSAASSERQMYTPPLNSMLDRSATSVQDSGYQPSHVGSPTGREEKLQRECDELRDETDAIVTSYKQREAILRTDLDAALERERTLQSDFNGLLKEFDRLTMSIADFGTEKHQLTALVERLRADMAALQSRLHEELAKNFGRPADDATAPPSTVQIRAEFRRVVEQIRTEYRQDLGTEVKLRAEAEKLVRAMKREREMEAYAKTNQSVQTVDSLMLPSTL